MNQRIRQAVLRTVCYSDVFNYALTPEEIWYWLADKDGNKFSKAQIARYLSNSRMMVRNKTSDYVCLQERKKIINLRVKRSEVSQNKVKVARTAASWLSRIPTVEALLITGSLAMNNAEDDDDIDLMVLTAPGCVWVTRFWCVIVMELAGMRRRPRSAWLLPESNLGHKKEGVTDKICLNLFLDRENLQMPSDKRDLYFAHEILQAKLIFTKSKSYGQFINMNSWIAGILPNALAQVKKDLKKNLRLSTASGAKKLDKIVVWLMRRFELPLFWIQRRYMSRRRSREIVTANTAMFHPFDYHSWVMKEYGKRLRKYNIKT